ncbi:MAG: serine hydrolase domain-containing protein, partial [Bacteroidota bacterium]
MSKKGKNIFFGIGFSAILFVFFISHEESEGIDYSNTLEKIEIDLPETKTHLDSVIEEYTSYFKMAFDSAGVPGAAICVVSDTQVVYSGTFGVKKVNSVDFVDNETVFRLASVSKSFAALLISIMVDEGVIDWDDRVTEYLPYLRFKAPATTNNLTIRHLLSHTTGLVPHAYDNFVEENVPYNQILQSLEFVDICCYPGEVYGYQNVAYSLIADILRVRTGKSYQQLLEEKVFKPFGMNTATADFDGIYKRLNHAAPHVNTWRGWAEVHPEKSYYAVAPAAGVNASITDMGQYLKMLLQMAPDPTDTSTTNNIFAPHVYSPLKWTYTRYWNGVKERYYALGWRLYKAGDKWIVYHGGYVRGYRAEIALFPEENIGIAVLMNGANRLASQSIPYFFNRYFNKSRPFED